MGLSKSTTKSVSSTFYEQLFRKLLLTVFVFNCCAQENQRKIAHKMLVKFTTGFLLPTKVDKKFKCPMYPILFYFKFNGLDAGAKVKSVDQTKPS